MSDWISRGDAKRELLAGVTYQRGARIRSELELRARSDYQMHLSDDEYFAFLRRNEHEFCRVHPQCTNHLEAFKLFTVKSQWVYGDCLEECLDQAMENGSSSREKDG